MKVNKGFEEYHLGMRKEMKEGEKERKIMGIDTEEGEEACQ